MGFAPIKWTCTAFFWPRQLTDRAILAIRQTQEKKDYVYSYRLTGLRLSCPHTSLPAAPRWLPSCSPLTLPQKKNTFFGRWGGAVGVLAGCVGCFCVLLRLFGLSLSLPKVACHDGNVGNDSWLKWYSNSPYCVKAQQNLVNAIDLDRQYSYPSAVQWQSREKYTSKVWSPFGPQLHQSRYWRPCVQRTQ